MWFSDATLDERHWAGGVPREGLLVQWDLGSRCGACPIFVSLLLLSATTCLLPTSISTSIAEARLGATALGWLSLDTGALALLLEARAAPQPLRTSSG